MALILDALVNAWRFVRNVYTRLGKPPDYVVFEIRGALPEFEPPASLLRRRAGVGAPSVSLEQLRERLGRVGGEGRCRGVILRIRNLSADWASLEELRTELDRYRGGGGHVVAYLTDADTRAYYLACVADEVFAAPVSTLAVLGIRTRINFLKDALGRIGLEAEVLAVSPYKSAGDALVRNDFSREAREQAERLLNRRFEELVRAVSEGRGLSPADVRRKIDRAPYGADGALAEGLLDGVCYEDELPGKLGSDGERAKLAEWGSARRRLRLPYRRTRRHRIGVVTLSGTIVRGRSRKLPVPVPLIGAEQAGSESVIGALRTAEKNRRVAAVLFYVDSRGGDALASDLIWREVERVRGKKPVVVLMGDAAASGGYYVSAAANHIFARRGTITGSIGVVITRLAAVGLYNRLGVHPASLERGAHVGIFDASRRPSADELARLKHHLGWIYEAFKTRVARGRDISTEELEGIAGGRVWTGLEARALGLVDEVGGLRAALRRAGELAGVDAEAPGALLKISPPRSGLPAPGGPADALPEFLEELREAASGLRGLQVWAVSAYEISED